MRSLWFLAVAACGGGSSAVLDAPDDCAPDELHIIHGETDERIAISNYAFGQGFGEGDAVGELFIGQPPVVHIELGEVAPRGFTVPARGRVTLPSGLDVGNCETGGFDGLIFVGDGHWRFELVGLATAPYCGGAPVAASVQGCYLGAPD